MRKRNSLILLISIVALLYAIVRIVYSNNFTAKVILVALTAISPLLIHYFLNWLFPKQEPHEPYTSEKDNK